MSKKYWSSKPWSWRDYSDFANYGKVPPVAARGFVTITSTDVDGTKHRRKVPIAGPIPGVPDIMAVAA